MLRGINGVAQVASRRGDTAGAMRALEAAAAAGDTLALGWLADHYGGGTPPRDSAKAADALRRGALLGDPGLMLAYALWIEDANSGNPSDLGLQANLIRRAADTGNAQAVALFEVGRVTGRFGMRRDREAGVANLRKLANAGGRDAQFWLGRLLHIGAVEGGTKDEAAKWIRRAAQQGDAAALKWLAANGLTKD
jgi:uncharacterized protein